MTDEQAKELIAAAERARDVLRRVAEQRRKLGPLATQAQSAAWQISAALKPLGNDG